MPDVIPSSLTSYVLNSLTATSLTLLTSVLNTPSNWLTIRFLHTILQNSNETSIARSAQGQDSDTGASVIFISLIRPLDLWTELGRKIGLDIASLVKARRLCCIDGLRPPISIDGPQDAVQSLSVPLEILQLKHLQAAFTKVAREVITTKPKDSSSRSNPFVIIDGLDFLIASQPETDAIQLQQFLSTIRSQAEAVILTLNADSALLHNRDNSAMPLERQHSAFVTSIAHQSSWVMQCRGLDTGTAKDVTGVLRVCRGGGIDEDDSVANDLVDSEWLYQLKGDGSARLWSRGESK